MPITIVSAPPKTAPTAETSVAPENTGSGADFAQVLFGQLFRTSSGTDSLGSLDTEPKEEDTGEGALSNDPLALLAVLTQAPTETRREITDASLKSSGDLTRCGVRGGAVVPSVRGEQPDAVSLFRLPHTFRVSSSTYV